MWTPPTHYYLESSGQVAYITTHPNTHCSPTILVLNVLKVTFLDFSFQDPGLQESLESK